ncbi:MAG: 50S ribosomal protein L10 [Elusimicrobiota bacterium]|jgi:large subunit ribosomal protein L10|nr:50S ribosomal protein L10 [Elusimicrobiota bacterium]
MPNLKNQQKVKNLTEKIKSANGMILTHYHGLTVSEISELRAKLRAAKSEYTVVKNTLAEIVFKELGIDTNCSFVGPVAIVFEGEDIVLPAKIVVEFSKTHSKLKITSGFFDGKFVDESFVKLLSDLPSKEILIAKMLSSMNSPISGFVNVLVANIRGLITVLKAISEKQVA